MNINHVAIWADNLELLRSFYTEYFGGCCGSRYHNPTKGFTSYIVAFDGGARLELMHKDGLSRPLEPHLGFAHISFQSETRRVWIVLPPDSVGMIMLL